MSYRLNKILSIGSIVLVILFVQMLISVPETRWTFLFIFALIFGYTHFLVGGYYQWRALNRRDDTKAKTWVIILTILSALTGFFIWQAGVLVFFFAFILTGFVIHSVINEIEFIQKYTSVKIDSVSFFVVAVIGFLLPLFLGLMHPSAHFTLDKDGSFNFFASTYEAALSQFEYLWFPAANVPMVVGGLVGFGLLVVLIRMVILKQYKFQFAMLVGLLLYGWILYKVAPVSYVHILFITLTYHSFSWFFLYYERFTFKQQKEWGTYMLWHLYVIVPLVLIVLWIQFDKNESILTAHNFFFDMHVYFTVTLAHGMVSLLNEEWCKKILRLSQN